MDNVNNSAAAAEDDNDDSVLEETSEDGQSLKNFNGSNKSRRPLRATMSLSTMDDKPEKEEEISISSGEVFFLEKKILIDFSFEILPRKVPGLRQFEQGFSSFTANVFRGIFDDFSKWKRIEGAVKNFEK